MKQFKTFKQRKSNLHGFGKLIITFVFIAGFQQGCSDDSEEFDAQIPEEEVQEETDSRPEYDQVGIWGEISENQQWG